MDNILQKVMSPEIIAYIQSLQDSLASLANISLVITDLQGNALTISSNITFKCSQCSDKFSELPCINTFRTAINEAAQKRKTVTVQGPCKLFTSVVPLGSITNNNHRGIDTVLWVGKVFLHNESYSELFAPTNSFSPQNVDIPTLTTREFGQIVKTLGQIFDLIFFFALNKEKMKPEFFMNKTALASSQDYSLLTKREKEILGLVSLGLSNILIAKRLYISEKTVKSHITNILKKLHLKNRTELAIYSVQFRK